MESPEKREQAKKQFSELLEKYMYECNLNNSSLQRKIEACGIKVDRKTVGTWKNAQNLPDPENIGALINALIYSYKELNKKCPLVSIKTRDEFCLVARGIIREEVTSPILTEATKPNLNPICSPKEFFGHAELLRRFSTSWWNNSNLQHIAIIGGRCSGKTSLLNYLEQIVSVSSKELRSDQPQGWENHWMPKKFQFSYIDFNSIATRNIDYLLPRLLEKLDVETLKTCDLYNFISIVENLKEPIVFLMDNIHKAIPELEVDIWNTFRYLGEKSNIGFVVTSQEPIEKWAKQYAKDSPFFNIFSTIKLKPLIKNDARALIKHFQQPLTVEEYDWMIEKSGGWPVLLQHFCSLRFDSEYKKDWQKKSEEITIKFSHLFDNFRKNEDVNTDNTEH